MKDLQLNELDIRSILNMFNKGENPYLPLLQDIAEGTDNNILLLQLRALCLESGKVVKPEELNHTYYCVRNRVWSDTEIIIRKIVLKSYSHLLNICNVEYCSRYYKYKSNDIKFDNAEIKTMSYEDFKTYFNDEYTFFRNENEALDFASLILDKKQREKIQETK